MRIYVNIRTVEIQLFKKLSAYKGEELRRPRTISFGTSASNKNTFSIENVQTKEQQRWGMLRTNVQALPI